MKGAVLVPSWTNNDLGIQSKQMALSEAGTVAKCPVHAPAKFSFICDCIDYVIEIEIGTTFMLRLTVHWSVHLLYSSNARAAPGLQIRLHVIKYKYLHP